MIDIEEDVRGTRLSPEVPYSRGYKIAAGLLAVTLTCSVSTSLNEIAQAIPVLVALDKDCAPVSDADLQKVETMYADTWVAPSVAHSPADYPRLDKEYLQRRQETAKKLGLTIYDVDAEYAALKEAIYNNGESTSAETSVPLKNFLQEAEDFLSRYDVSLVFPGDDPTADIARDNSSTEHTPLTRKEFLASDSDGSKWVLYSLIVEFGQLPVELVKNTGLKHIVITDITGHLKSGSGVAGFFDTGSRHLNGDTIYIDRLNGGGSVAIHEMTHLWDAQVCGEGGMARDSQYSALNPAPAKGAQTFYNKPGDYYSFEGLGRVVAALPPEEKTPEDKIARSAQIDAMYARIVTVSDYGMTNVMEDKATVGEYLFDSYNNRPLMEDVNSPILRQKMLLLATRLYEQQPAAAEYLASISRSLNDTNICEEQLQK